MAEQKKPWWQTDGVLDGASPHEPIAFMVRRGGCAEDVEARYEREFGEARAKEISAEGSNFVETCFFKGLGLQAEAMEMARTKRFIAFLHKHGVRAGVYTQWGTLFNETFFHEIPAAREWVQIGVDGKPIEYGDRIPQYFRWRGCPGNKDFLAFIKRVCKLAIEEHKVDVIYFDNMCLFEFHDTLCYCETCRKGFREYLAKKFPRPESSWKRLGLWRTDAVEPPRFRPWSEHTEKAVPLIDPLVQEFIEFRCEQLADAWREVAQYIKSVNPETGLMGNPSFPRKYNERLTSAIDFWRLRGTEAMYYMENAVSPAGMRDGAVSTNARGYKYGRALGLTFVPCGGAMHAGLGFCEGLAFNDGSGHVCQGAEPYLGFFRKNRDRFYRDVEPAAEVAVLRHDPSLTWRWHEAFTVMELAQQELLCGGVPWMPLWGQQLLDGSLDRYRVLVVPGAACLSRAELDAIDAFVQRGGGLVLLENAGMLDEYHHTIKRWRFAHMFQSVAKKEGFDLRYSDRWLKIDFDNRRLLVARHGKGRAIYIPQIRKSAEPVHTYSEIGGYDGLQHLVLPVGWRELAKAVERAAGSTLAVKTVARSSVIAEFLRKSDSGELLVHLVNYERRRVVPGAEVVLAQADGVSAQLHLPGEGIEGKPLKIARTKDGRGRIRLPGFARYALVAISKS